MAWCRPGIKPLSEPIMVNLLTHICITRPQWVKWEFWWTFLQLTRLPTINDVQNLLYGSFSSMWQRFQNNSQAYIFAVDFDICRADSSHPPSQWEMSLQCNAICHWLGANLKSVLYLACQLSHSMWTEWAVTNCKSPLRQTSAAPASVWKTL